MARIEQCTRFLQKSVRNICHHAITYRYNDGMHRIQIQLRPDQIELLRNESARSGSSVSKLVRDAVDAKALRPTGRAPDAAVAQILAVCEGISRDRAQWNSTDGLPPAQDHTEEYADAVWEALQESRPKEST